MKSVMAVAFSLRSVDESLNVAHRTNLKHSRNSCSASPDKTLCLFTRRSRAASGQLFYSANEVGILDDGLVMVDHVGSPCVEGDVLLVARPRLERDELNFPAMMRKAGG